MAAMKSTRSPAGLAASRLLEEEFEATRRGEEPRYGARAAIIPADLATAERIKEHHDEGWPVVIVDEDGNERFLPVP